MGGVPSFSLRRTALCSAVAVGLFGVAALGLHPRWLRAGHFVEAAAYGGLVSVLLGHPPLRSAFDTLTRRGRLLFGVLCTALFLGQMFGGGRHIFPLVRFAMFTDALNQPAPGMYYQATFADGSRRLMQPAEMLPPGSEGRFEGMAKAMAEKLRTAHVPTEAWPTSTLGRTVRGLGDAYNSMHPDAPIARIDVSSCCSDYQMDAARPHARRTELFSILMGDGADGPR